MSSGGAGPLRLLHLIPSLSVGGGERQLALIGTELAQRGHSVHIGVLDDQPVAFPVDDAVKLHPLPRAGFARAVRRLLCASRPDLLQTWFSRMDLVGGPLARLHGVPWILSERSSAVAYPGHPILRARRLLGRLADAVLANSEAGVAYWSAGPSRHRLRRAIGNAIDLPAIRGTPPDDSRPWRSDVPTVLFVGRLVLEKDLPTLARAFARLRASCPAQLVVVGDGPLRGAFETELTDAGVQDAVTFLGVRGDVWALMKRADVLVLGSTVEGHPNVVIEAMACGLPLVVSRIPAHTGFLSEREALFHPPSDSDALAAVLAHALTDRSAATTRAAAAERLVTQYAITRITDQHEQFYRELLGMTTPQARATAEGRA